MVNATNECLACLRKQVRNTCSILQAQSNLDSKHTRVLGIESNQVESRLDCMIDSFDISTKPCPPPKLAKHIYEQIATISGIKDPYKHIKLQSITKAQEIISQIPMQQSLDFGLKVAALGNVIDYGSASAFDIHSYTFHLDSIEFAHYDKKAFQAKLECAKNLVYIGDNAGENIFDEFCIRILKSLYPHLCITYFVRGYPIINDITLDDLRQTDSSLFALCEVLDSGVASPGFLYGLASDMAKQAYDKADVILAKGMGNFECLEIQRDERLFLLFKVKCQVVADFLNQDLGKFMFIQCKMPTP